MRFKWFIFLLCALLATGTLAVRATDSHISVPDSGSAKARTKSYTRTSDSAVVQMQLFQQGFLELNFGATSNCTDTAGVCDSTTLGQIFDEITTSGTSQLIALDGANMANYLAVTCECDDSDVDFTLRPGYRHFNATDKVSAGSLINFDNTMGTITGFTTLETAFRHTGMAVVETLGAKNMVFRLTMNAGAAPRVSCWFSRL